jgi:hypothetical protein
VVVCARGSVVLVIVARTAPVGKQAHDTSYPRHASRLVLSHRIPIGSIRLNSGTSWLGNGEHSPRAQRPRGLCGLPGQNGACSCCGAGGRGSRLAPS